jgi:4'-phosphopantetheinyl transferase EntD
MAEPKDWMMFEQLLPMGVAVVEIFGDISDEPIFPGEEDLIEHAVGSHRPEFVTARRCARTALRKLGYPPFPIRRGFRHEPQWPVGIVGSITKWLRVLGTHIV